MNGCSDESVQDNRAQVREKSRGPAKSSRLFAEAIPIVGSTTTPTVSVRRAVFVWRDLPLGKNPARRRGKTQVRTFLQQIHTLLGNVTASQVDRPQSGEFHQQLDRLVPHIRSSEVDRHQVAQRSHSWELAPLELALVSFEPPERLGFS